ncbi:hypothetical protein AUK11_00360 [bacterium CG2_30_37_16]|nr:MAG: hypothetical protein AUK11_00360 [bacterium CG2_30_37_16]PIP31228.1 MAG: hypothetical protein COX25_00450 [bacterium (Candidatus Howlettbacteria) CG23_combo_of_CG06-09_8_20_14_all_37_9]PIY00271.1 MAG: hypothetical protein COZ22_00660 [bacterium (Candidatus Howlettbacteria) CG_4_10_14_3_um_filter_37_10]PJB06203.1 MAG: hypothetical protein CO123_02565 [bacterium (Candidatus Howlettbacteria) CG_4_9_14_3_um_filter_37_10]
MKFLVKALRIVDMEPKRFVSPEKTLAEIGIDKKSIVIDFGSGSGHWTIAAAKSLGPSGKVFAVDNNEDLLKRLSSMAMLGGYGNVVTKFTNLLTLDQKDISSADLSILANTLSFFKMNEIIIKKAFEMTKEKGKLLVVEWKKQDHGFGPPDHQRVGKKELLELAKKTGFNLLGEIPAGHYHYAIVFEKP